MENEVRNIFYVREHTHDPAPSVHTLSTSPQGVTRYQFALCVNRASLEENIVANTPILIDTVDPSQARIFSDALLEKYLIEVVFRPEQGPLRYGDDAWESQVASENLRVLTVDQQQQAVQLLRRIADCDDAASFKEEVSAFTTNVDELHQRFLQRLEKKEA